MLDLDLAVIGPVPTSRFGLASGCIECHAHRPADAERCNGFGPGCLGARGTDHDPRSIDAEAAAR